MAKPGASVSRVAGKFRGVPNADRAVQSDRSEEKIEFELIDR